jgi:hypothetical protein
MSTDTYDREDFLEKLLKGNSIRKGGLTAVERLVIISIAQKMTYQQAGIKYQYTESSFQNAASRLFKDLSSIVGTPVNRQNILSLIDKERHIALNRENAGKLVFDRINADFWVRAERAQLISVSYRANQVIDLTEYLVKYSSSFKATFCVDIDSDSTPSTTLLHLCDCLQIPTISLGNDPQSLLKSIKLTLQKRSVLLVLRFDRTGEIRQQWGDYLDILITLGNIGNGICLLVLHKELDGSSVDTRKSLDYQVRLAINVATGIQKMGASSNNNLSKTRLISINNNQQIICNLMQAYMK